MLKKYTPILKELLLPIEVKNAYLLQNNPSTVDVLIPEMIEIRKGVFRNSSQVSCRIFIPSVSKSFTLGLRS